MSKLLQEINLQVLRQPHRHPGKQSPVYHQPYQQQTIPSRQFPNINCFQTQQESNMNQNPTFTSMLDNDFSSNPIMPGDLFKGLTENDKS